MLDMIDEDINAGIWPTRALSLIQPWAWAVIHAGKDVENRVWWSTIRGPFWIASSATTTRRYYEQAREIIESVSGQKVPPMADLEYGAVIGRATIVDCILPGGFAFENHQQARGARAAHLLGLPGGKVRHPRAPRRWHFLDQYGYVLTERQAVKPVPVKGHQRWYSLPHDVLRRILEQKPVP